MFAPIYFRAFHGGFGALRLGAKYAGQYAGISAHSSVTEIAQMKHFVEEPEVHFQQRIRSDEDAFTSIVENKSRLPPLRFDCGFSDILAEHNRILHQKLINTGVNHRYEEFEGGIAGNIGQNI